MPTKRRRSTVARSDVMTDAQKTHLQCGVYFFDFDGEVDHFVDDTHRRETWAAYRDLILAEWDHAGRRPHAMWGIDYGLEVAQWPRNFRWPPPVETEQEMVHRLVSAGELEPCLRNGAVRIADEVRWIEEGWRTDLRLALRAAPDGVDPRSLLLQSRGVPSWYVRRHAAEVAAAIAAEDLARSRVAAPGGRRH